MDTAIRVFNTVDIAVAVAYEGGLITPILWDADRKGVAQISAEMKALAERARAGKLKPEEYQGGSFSDLEHGHVRHHASSPSIINPPSAGILAVGAGEQRPVVKIRQDRDRHRDDRDHHLRSPRRRRRPRCHLAPAFKGFIERPATMLA